LDLREQLTSHGRWPEQPEHHISTLYRIRSKKVEQLVVDGYQTLNDLPKRFKHRAQPSARAAASGPASSCTMPFRATKYEPSIAERLR
jgi:hypothetical protein